MLYIYHPEPRQKLINHQRKRQETKDKNDVDVDVDLDLEFVNVDVDVDIIFQLLPQSINETIGRTNDRGMKDKKKMVE